MADQTPTTEQLAALVAGELGPDEAAELRRRVGADPRSARLLEEIERIAAFLVEEPSAQPAADLVRRVQRSFGGSRPGLAEALREGVRRVIAALDFDSRLPDAALGFRGTAEAAQLSFSCDDAEIDLELTPAGERVWLVRGQIDAEFDQPPTVELFESDGPSPLASAHADQHGGFTLEAPEGTHVLRVTLDDMMIEAGPVLIP
ncbi:MAG: hypothetical protein DHS20C14_17500 [Phycisphaeraceae bacterium]|nr:MAG: hypothetical protein DHS20C14_17500 [Phycisphaeraceae bacterium]